MRFTSKLWITFTLILSALGCFGMRTREADADSGSSRASGRDDQQLDAGGVDSGDSDVAPSASQSPGPDSSKRNSALDSGDSAFGRSPSECSEISNAIAREVPDGYCTAVVRFNYETLEQIGHAFVCQTSSSSTKEAEARAAVAAATSFIDSRLGEGELLTGSEQDPVWVFYQRPSDIGGVAVVSRKTGLTVFAGSMIFGGAGQVVIPADWNTTDIGDGCVRLQEPLGSVPGFDLRAGREMNEPEPARMVLESVLPTVLSEFASSADPPLVLLYVPKTAATDMMRHAEYVVLADGFADGD